MLPDPAELTDRHPTTDDGQLVLDLLIACDIADYGEPDSSLGDLLHDWAQVDLARDARLLLTPDGRLASYAIVMQRADGFNFDIYTHPTLGSETIRSGQLARCETRARALMSVAQNDSMLARAIVAHINEADRQALAAAGYQPRKFYFRMQIEMETAPAPPTWPDGCGLRNIRPGEDDRAVHAFIEAAFDRPGRTPTTFEWWRDFMMRPDHFRAELWFLLTRDAEIIGTALCYDYPEGGWVRQLAVESAWRRQGIGAALLQHVFGVFYRSGHPRVSLVVDSDNPNAHTFYERVGMVRARQHDEYHKMLGLDDAPMGSHPR